MKSIPKFLLPLSILYHGSMVKTTLSLYEILKSMLSRTRTVTNNHIMVLRAYPGPLRLYPIFLPFFYIFLHLILKNLNPWLFFNSIFSTQIELDHRIRIRIGVFWSDPVFDNIYIKQTH